MGEDRHADPVVVHDDQGVQWVVTERDCTSVPGARTDRCLVFMSEYAVRRIWAFPRAWRTLSPDELLVLSQRR
jgi:hypothetical protein